VFLVSSEEKLLYFENQFDDRIDDYDEYYVVYLMPEMKIDDLWAWKGDLAEIAKERIGRVKVLDVEFDPTRRKAIGAEVLSRFYEQ
jgi:hypothetical protein